MRLSIFVCFLIFYGSLFSQKNFTSIVENDSLTDTQKDQSFDSLLARYASENKIDSLLKETFEIISWNYQAGNLKKAIALSKKNIAFMDSVNYSDKIFYRRLTYGLGFYQRKQGDSQLALQTLKSLINNEEPDEYALRSANIIAEIYSTEDDYYNALTYYKLYRNFSQKLNRNKRFALATLDIAKSCLRINTKKSLDEAIKIVSSTLAYLEKSPQDTVHSYYFILLYKSLGNLHSDRQEYNFDIATKYFDKALAIATKNNDWEEISNINNDIGLIYLKDKRAEAKTYFLKALSYRSSREISCIIHRNLAQSYLDNGEYEEALQYIQKSLDIITLRESKVPTELPKKEELHSLSAKNQIIASLNRKAEIWIAFAKSKTNSQDEYAHALNTIKRADWLIDIAKRSSEYKSKLFWRKTATDLYIKGVEIAYLTHRPEDAFYFIEKNKALQLLEDVNLKSARANTEIPETISTKEQALKAKIIALENEGSISEVVTSNRDLIIAKNNYERFIDSLATNIKLLYKLEKSAEVVSIDTLRDKLLQSQQAYIEYILDEEDGYGLVITKEGFSLFKINKLEELQKLALAYRTFVNSPITDKQSVADYRKTAHSLYKLLFPTDIQELIKNRELTIIPDYFLQNIPFEALMTAEDDPEAFLIFQNQVNYAYSLTFLIENKKLKKVNKNSISAFAPINFEDNLPALKNTQMELEAIDQLAAMDAFFYEEATKRNFFEHSKDAKIIHIASHANASDSINPWISFYDGKLNLNELYNHNTAADLVVLSACKTSLGEVYKGEGVMSLSRGFFNSGSQSVLTTLWEINDKATLQIVNGFYQNLKEGQNKSLALHNAKLAYLKRASLSEASPYYWASFILIGDTGKIDLPDARPYLYYLLALIALATILFVFLKKDKKTG